MIRCPQCSKLAVRDVTHCKCGHVFNGTEPDATPTQQDVSEWQQTHSGTASSHAPRVSRGIPIFSAFISTLLLLGMALTLLGDLSTWSTLPRKEQYTTILTVIAAVTAALSGWIYVVTRRVGVGKVHGLIMAIIGCFGLHKSLDSLTHRSKAGARGPDVNPMGGIDHLLDFVGVALGAVVLLCGVVVIWNIRNASRRNHNGT